MPHSICTWLCRPILVSMPFLCLAILAQAQPYTVRYEAATGLLPTQACPAWTSFIEGSGGTTSITPDGMFRISNGTQFDALSYHVPLQFADPIIIEFRGRRPSGTTSSPARSHMGVIIGKGSSVGVHFFVGDDVIFLTGGLNTRGPQANVDTDFLHTYRIEVAGSVVRVYYDGALTLTGSTYTSSEFSGPVIQWGDFTNSADGVSDWEYFQHNSSAVACDYGPPQVAAPGDASYQCASEVPPAAPGQAVATDDRGVTSLTVTELANGGAGSFTSPLVLTRTWTATDSVGNSASDSQVITVIDDTPPSLTVPENIEANAGPGVESCMDVRVLIDELGTATSQDNCGEVTVALAGVPEGNLFSVGVTALTYTATDAAGNATEATQTVTVRCLVGMLAGSATRTCNGSTIAADAATVRLLHEGTPFREVVTVAGGSYAFDDVRLGTYTVQVVPPSGFAVPIDTRVVTLTEEGATEAVEPLAFTCLLGDIAGQVEGDCNGSTGGLLGVTVDLFREGPGGMDVLVGSMATDVTGAYHFDDLALGEYTVAAVVPLGYSSAGSSQELTLTQPDGLVDSAPFTFACQPITAEPRGMGFWKHQVNVYLTGKGHAEISLEQLLGYLDLLTEHFNENVVNPVIVYVPGSTNTTDKLLQLQQLLTVNRGGTALDRAKRELLALLLNVVSGKISQTQTISDDGATVSQAITYCDNLIDTPAGDYGRAQAICEYINGGTEVPAGLIPLTTAQIAYRREMALRTFRVTPNPGLGARRFQFEMAQEGRVRLNVYDVSGRLVRSLVEGWLSRGLHTLTWNGTAESGHVGNGVYFARLEIQGGSRTIKLIQLAH